MLLSERARFLILKKVALLAAVLGLLECQWRVDKMALDGTLRRLMLDLCF